MLLIEVKETNGWRMSRWRLTYRVGWENILKACNLMKDYYANLEIFAGDTRVSLTEDNHPLEIEEAMSLTVRGISTVLKVPMVTTFYNQTNTVDVTVAMSTEEFAKGEYEPFNKSLCTYLDSVELAMYR